MSPSDTSKKTSQNRSNSAGFALFSILLGVVGWLASFALLTEYIKTLVEPGYSPNCNLSVLITCGPNMGSWQGSLFGFSNTIIGVAAFTAPIFIGVALLAGASFKTWFWRIYGLGLLGGFIFVTWLAYQSIFSLGTLCPWCMVVWLAMIPLWWVSFARMLSAGNLGSSQSAKKLGKSLLQWSWVIIFINLLLIAAVSQFRLNWLFTEFGIGSY